MQCSRYGSPSESQARGRRYLYCLRAIEVDEICKLTARQQKYAAAMDPT